MTTLVFAHGSRDQAGGTVWMPAGLNLYFYSEFDKQLMQANSLAMVARGEFGYATQMYTAGTWIPNYQLTRLDDREMLAIQQLDESGLSHWFVGDHLPDPTWLCWT